MQIAFGLKSGGAESVQELLMSTKYLLSFVIFRCNEKVFFMGQIVQPELILKFFKAFNLSYFTTVMVIVTLMLRTTRLQALNKNKINQLTCLEIHEQSVSEGTA